MILYTQADRSTTVAHVLWDVRNRKVITPESGTQFVQLEVPPGCFSTRDRKPTAIRFTRCRVVVAGYVRTITGPRQHTLVVLATRSAIAGQRLQQTTVALGPRAIASSLCCLRCASQGLDLRRLPVQHIHEVLQSLAGAVWGKQGSEPQPRLDVLRIGRHRLASLLQRRFFWRRGGDLLEGGPAAVDAVRGQKEVEVDKGGRADGVRVRPQSPSLLTDIDLDTQVADGGSANRTAGLAAGAS